MLYSIALVEESGHGSSGARQFSIAGFDAVLDCWPLLFMAGLLRDMNSIYICVPYLCAECRGLEQQMCGDSVSANSRKL